MRTYARIQSGAVAEILSTDQDITHLFHPALRWVEVTGQRPQVGWLPTAQGFTPPPAPAPTAAQAPPPTLAQLQAQLNELSERVSKLAPAHA